MNKTTSYKEYYSALREFSMFPQMQNLLHFFAYKNYGKHLTEALKDEKVPYQSDNSDNSTPLLVALENQSFEAIDSIMSYFKHDSPNLFLTLKDVYGLTNYKT